MAAFQGFDLPEVSADKLASMSREDLLKHLKQLEEYMYTLTEQLRYTLNNLDADNMSDDFVAEVSNSSAVRALTQTVENVQNGMKSVQKQTVEGFENVVYKDEVVSSINQTAELVKINASKIALEGYVTINGTFKVDENGYLRCDGGEIGGFEITDETLESSGVALDTSSYGGSLIVKYNGDEVGYVSAGGPNQMNVTCGAAGNTLRLFGGGSYIEIKHNNIYMLGGANAYITVGLDRIDIGSSGTAVYINGKLYDGGGGGSVRCGESSISGTWRDMPSGTNGATAVAAFCSDSQGFAVKTRYQGGWQWCIEGSSGESGYACWIAVD